MARRARRRFVRLIDLLPSVEQQAAVEMITGRQVIVDGRIVDNPRALVPAAASIVLRPDRPLRGTVKLRAALAVSGIAPAGRACLDLGAAAGGFTIALVEAGARIVYAVDTGYGQLLGRLRQDRRVVNLERTNLADLDRGLVPLRIDVMTIDLSYLPLADALVQLDPHLFSPGANLLALVKPTFELRQGRPVRDRTGIEKAIELAVYSAEGCGWHTVRTFPSPVTGRRRTPEAFLHAQCLGEGVLDAPPRNGSGRRNV